VRRKRIVNIDAALYIVCTKLRLFYSTAAYDTRIAVIARFSFPRNNFKLFTVTIPVVAEYVFWKCIRFVAALLPLVYFALLTIANAAARLIRAGFGRQDKRAAARRHAKPAV
jgi:hypothetical protein